MLLLAVQLPALEMPQAPSARVNDYARLLSSADASALESRLQQYETESSNQIVIALFPSLEGEDLNDFTNRLYEQWHLGTKKNNNGVLLAVFAKEHQVRIEVGYGLEGAVTDATASDIIRNEIVPAFRQNQYSEGLNAAVTAIEKAARGEYKATPPAETTSYSSLILFIAFVLLFLWLSRRRRSGIFLPGSGYSRGGLPWIFFPTGGGNRSDRGSGFGGGGFSGGGGLSGGGGASGSW